MQIYVLYITIEERGKGRWVDALTIQAETPDEAIRQVIAQDEVTFAETAGHCRLLDPSGRLIWTSTDKDGQP